MPTDAPYRLVRTPPPPVVPPVLDDSQLAVVEHPGGPLLVLAGPGTGKTTTMVEAVVERVRRGLAPDAVLVLTFSRKAADELRERITSRLGRTVRDPSAWTFHAWCLALVAAYEGQLPRLLSGPERLVRVRELLAGAAAGEGTTRWPARLADALRTHGMAREAADLLDRARERGVEPPDLRVLAAGEGRDDWTAAADFFEEYAAVLDRRGEMDYAELVRRALQLLSEPAVLAEVRARYGAVFVDEYQDTDPSQERLLQLLAGGGRDLVVVGDPDQSVYAFRGADVSCILRFPGRFRTVAGAEAPTMALAVSRRAGAGLLEVSREVARRIPAPGLAGQRLLAHRALRADAPVDGSAEVRLFGTAADEVTAIADLLRRAHLDDGLPWSAMAVLVRSGVRSIPLVRRALVAAGVPVAVAADEVPVARDPAVAPLLLALRVAADPSSLTDDSARTLLTSPLVRATPSDVRRLGRALRQLDRDALAGETPGSEATGSEATGGDVLVAAAGGARHPGDGADVRLLLPRPSATLVREAVLSPGDVLLVDERVARPVTRLASLLAAAREVFARQGGAEEALWVLWERSGLPRRLAAASARGGQEGRAADRDLDAVVALFDAVARLEERQPRAGVQSLLDELESQEIPAQSRREGAIATGGAVRLLTAHRAKGLEWDLVVVAGVQDSVWPDLRRRSSLLEGDRLGRQEVLPPATPTGLLVDERRLFYVAVTRARRRLVVTAVRSVTDDGDRPSRFLDELGVPVPERNERPTRLLSLSSLVGRLRRVLVDPGSPEPLRRVAAGQLARLAAPDPDRDGVPRVRTAHPSSWWGLTDPTPGAHPVRPPGEPVRLSGSGVDGYETCPLRWFLDREVHAAQPATATQGFGLVIHALARLVSTGALPPDVDVLLDRLDRVWGSLGFDARWQSARERADAERALRRFLTWHSGRDREWLASEAPFEVGYAGTLLRGSIDRVERDAEGRVVVVDFKTGRGLPSSAEVDAHAQLGLYQVAVREGGLRDQVGDDVSLGGAELVHLRQQYADGRVKVQRQSPLEPAPAADEGADGVAAAGAAMEGAAGAALTWADDLIRRVAAGIAAENFAARVNDHCDRCAFARACPAQDEGGQVVS